MLDGTYAVMADTPLGKKDGTLVMHRAVDADSGALEMTLDVRGVRISVDEASFAGDTFSCTGSVRVMLKSVPFSCHGKVVDNALRAQGTSGVAKIEIAGMRS